MPAASPTPGEGASTATVQQAGGQSGQPSVVGHQRPQAGAGGGGSQPGSGPGVEGVDLGRDRVARRRVGDALWATDGWATIETYTVKHGRTGNRTGIVVGRLEDDGRRFLARTDDGDDEVLALLATGEPIGQRVFVRSTEGGNRVTCGEVHPA